MSTIIKVRTGEEAQNLAMAVRDGIKQEDGSVVPLTPEQKSAAMAGLRQYDLERKEALDFQEKQRDAEGNLPDKPELQVIDPTVDQEGNIRNDDGLGSDLARRTGGAVQVAAVMGTGVVAEPFAGLAGAYTLARTGDPDAAAESVLAVQDGLTFAPRNETGNDMLMGLMGPLSLIEEGADWIAVNGSFGNPYAATAIKTGLLGGMEFLGLKGGRRVRIPQKLKDIQDAAAEMGIQLDANNMQSSIIEAAHNMSPAERAQNAGFLQEAMRQAAEESRNAVDAAFDQAREGRAFVEVKEVNGLSKAMAEQLQAEGWDFRMAGMGDIVNQLDDLANIGSSQRPGSILQQTGKPFTGTERITQRVQDVEAIRRRLVKLGRSSDGNVRGAANRMKGMMDDWMDHQLADGLITGDPAVIAQWKDARIAHTDYMKNFKEDRMIRNLIEKEATPEQVRAWITGMNAIGAKANAATTINRMKEVLGENHPAIEGIRQDMLFEVAAPLMGDKPNFGRFIANYDKLIRNNPSIVKSLGLDEGSMSQLVDFARTAEKAGPNPRYFDQGLLVRGLATYFVGHQLARKALKVNFVRSVGSMMFGVNRVTQRAIIADLTNARHGQPIVPRNSAAAAVFISSHALSIAKGEDEKAKARAKAVEAQRAAAVKGQNPLL